MSAVGRNAPCPCGAKKPNGESIKFKACCLAKDEAQRKPKRDEDALLILQPSRGTICVESQFSLDHNVGIPARRLLRVVRKPVAQARNELAKYALEAVASGDLFDFTPRETFILWVDDDAFLPPQLVPQMLQAMREPALQRLDALFAWFCTRAPYSKPIAYRHLDDPESFLKIGVDCKHGDVVPIEAAGFHTVLMRPRLLQRIGADPFTPLPDREEGEDLAFCRRAKEIGALMAVGTSLPSPHIDPRDGTCYLPGTGTLIIDGNTLRNLGNDHLAGDGSRKTSEIRGYGLDAIESAAAKADAARAASVQAEIEQRRLVSAV